MTNPAPNSGPHHSTYTVQLLTFSLYILSILPYQQDRRLYVWLESVLGSSLCLRGKQILTICSFKKLSRSLYLESVVPKLQPLTNIEVLEQLTKTPQTKISNELFIYTVQIQYQLIVGRLFMPYWPDVLNRRKPKGTDVAGWWPVHWDIRVCVCVWGEKRMPQTIETLQHDQFVFYQRCKPQHCVISSNSGGNSHTLTSLLYSTPNLG